MTKREHYGRPLVSFIVDWKCFPIPGNIFEVNLCLTWSSDGQVAALWVYERVSD
jgi:hypothetical protein